MEKLTETPLHVAATRPALLCGMPLELAAFFFVSFGVITVIAHNALYGLVVVPVWWAAHLLVRRDYNAIRVTFLWLLTSACALDSHLWGGASISTLPIKPSKRPRGMAPDAW